MHLLLLLVQLFLLAAQLLADYDRPIGSKDPLIRLSLGRLIDPAKPQVRLADAQGIALAGPQDSRSNRHSNAAG